MSLQTAPHALNAPATADLHWRRIGAEWRLFHARRIVGRVLPDADHTRMWRVKLPGGVSDLVNLPRAKDAARGRAIRQIELRRVAAISRKKVEQIQGAFSSSSSYVRLNGADVHQDRPRRLGRAI